MRSSFVLGQDPRLVLRGVRPSDRLRRRVNTFFLHHDSLPFPALSRLPHNRWGVSDKPDREGMRLGARNEGISE